MEPFHLNLNENETLTCPAGSSRVQVSPGESRLVGCCPPLSLSLSLVCSPSPFPGVQVLKVNEGGAYSEANSRKVTADVLQAAARLAQPRSEPALTSNPGPASTVNSLCSPFVCLFVCLQCPVINQ